MKELGKPLPRIGPEPITFNPYDIGFTLETSKETADEIRRMKAANTSRVARASPFIMD